MTDQAGPGGERVDADPDDGRDETATERLDRNWNALLQELRVVETGTQILTGFLLTVAFQPTFRGLAAPEKTLYLVLVALATSATVLALMPVALHRTLFRQRAMDRIVAWTDVLLRAALAVVGLVVVGVAVLVFSVAAGPALAAGAGVVALVGVAVAWFVAPGVLRARSGRR
ncbi:DUF6328 family protein [Amnibacterium sp. CER49]|uniref:DUF6328 family protein n=1 Tax=Amnibacterium sp. CER49 TaxID=3039161 RepID=UPI0024469A14|nr:DUF6328 family protein [Amnibacterium sp. CER49]MDH2445045.1 DUF6328 family protein [Amnibacterium sp. CER49]